MDNKILNGTYFGCNKKTDIAQFIYQHFILFIDIARLRSVFCPYDLEAQLAINHTQAVLQGKKERVYTSILKCLCFIHIYFYVCTLLFDSLRQGAVKCQTTQDIHKLEYPAARAGRSGSIPIIIKTKRTCC